MTDYSKMPCAPPVEEKKIHVYKNTREPTVTPYQPQLSTRVSIFEAQKPNIKTRVVDSATQTIGESPPVPFTNLFKYRDDTPQIDAIIEYVVDLVVGTDININVDEDKTENKGAKEVLEKWSDQISLYEKIRSLADDAFTGGTSMFIRVFKGKNLDNIEQFDMTSIKKVIRDIFGNVKDFMVDDGNAFEKNLTKLGIKIDDVVPIIFRPRGRDFFGRSIFHGLAVERNVGNRTTRPIIEALWSLDDVVVGTLENFAYPVEYHIFDGINETDLELEAQKIKEAKPGDRFFLSRMHEIDRREPTQARFDSFFEHSSNLVQLGTGFPLEILLGDFTSRASSQTTDSLLMRRIKAFQQHLVKIIKKEILEHYLRHNTKWNDDDKIKNLELTVEFDTQTPMEYTPDQALARFTAGGWSIRELRQYDKANGQDLFDDKEVEQKVELKDEIQTQQDQSKQEDKESLREMAKLANSMLLKDIQKGEEMNE